MIERYESNGTAGSFNRYFVKYQVDGNKISLTPVKHVTHQDGLILPYPVPKFSEHNLTRYMAETQHSFEVEYKSKYNSESVNANFHRLLDKKYKSSWSSAASKIMGSRFQYKSDDALATFDVTSYPYRNGSLVKVKVVYHTLYNRSNLINLPEIESRIKEKIKSVVNA